MTNFVAITFDDGYVEHVKIARLLSNLEIKATFYLTTHIKELKSKKLLTVQPSLIMEIAELGHEIGSHTCTHRDLRSCDTSTLSYELRYSKLFLEDLLGTEILGLAYPWGYYNRKVLEVAQNYYLYARTTENNLKGKDINLLNSPPVSRYEICAIAGLTIKRSDFLELLKKIIRAKHKHLVIYTHICNPVKIVTFIKILQNINFKFVTLYELFTHLMEEYDL